LLSPLAGAEGAAAGAVAFSADPPSALALTDSPVDGVAAGSELVAEPVVAGFTLE
jgi:hypothetical protein